MSGIEHRIRVLESRLNTNDGICHCPGRERCVPAGHVDSRGILWYTNPDTCPDCGGSTIEVPGARMVIHNMSADIDTPIEALPFGGYDRWHPWGPPPGRQEEIYPTGVAAEVERTRTETGEWSRVVFVPIAELCPDAVPAGDRGERNCIVIDRDNDGKADSK